MNIWKKMFEGRNPNDELEVRWSRLHISIFDHYFLYLSNTYDIGEIRLPELFQGTTWTESGSSAIWGKVRVSLAQKLLSLFTVPTLNEFHQPQNRPNNTVPTLNEFHQPQNRPNKKHRLVEALLNKFRQIQNRLNKFHQRQNCIEKHRLVEAQRQNCIEKHRLVEALISFLLQLLYHKSDSILDSCQSRLANLEKDLRFLRTVLGDTSLTRCGDDHEAEFEKLISKFEAVANEAGSLLHFLLFSTDPAEVSDGTIAVVLNHMELLKDDIMKFVPLMSRAHTATGTSVMESLHVFDSLIYDLEDHLMNREDDPIKDLYEGLISLQSSIKEIGGPQPSEIGELREILMRIGDVAYEAQYLVISFFVGDAPRCYLMSRLANVNHKIELCGDELIRIRKKQKFGELAHVAEFFSSQLSLQSNKNSEVDDGVVGLEEKETYLLDKLAGGGDSLKVISIFGMPGLGKTTLAKKLYNHRLVSERFDKLSWCVVSQTHELRGLLSTILINIDSKFGKDKILNMEEETLIENIHKTLKGRRYLVALDDIWDSQVLDEVRRCLPDDGNGSRIMFTTRNRDVAPPSSIMYEMPHLTNDQCWELLQKKVFSNQPCPPQLRGIGEDIAANCRGLPLAVVVISGILSRTNKEESTWEEVRGNLASYIFDNGDDSVMQILKLSYKHLPQHLKPCFLYFGAFQKDKEIPVTKLMRLWVAEGFIHMENKEIKAVDYLTELIDRSLVMVVKKRSDGGVKTCKVHDLLRDLCLKTCAEENFMEFVESTYCSLYNEGHHLQTLQYSVTWSFSQHMRSLYGRDMMLPFHMRDMRSVRVLQFDCRSIYLTGIEYLVCLRYLVIRELPPSVGCLVNLEYLRVETKETVSLSSSIMTMKKLRYICVGSEAIYDKDCDNSQTNNLEFLSRVVIKEPKDEEMLKCSTRLRKLKSSTYQRVDLSFLAQLESLNIRIHDEVEGVIFPKFIKKLTLFGKSVSNKEMSMLGRLENLEVLKLRFISFEGKRWITRDNEFQKVKFLKLEVENLAEWNVDSSEHFPALEQLVLSDCGTLQDIPSEIGEITTLQVIEVRGICRNSLLNSAKNVQQEQVDMGNEDLRIITSSARLSFEDDDVCTVFKADKVLEQLIVGGAGLQVISILGIPGLGKTTLAKQLYNHPLVSGRFGLRSWCVVSQTYTRRSLLAKILIDVLGELEETILRADEKRIAKCLRKALSARRYLIVLDDVWDLEVWVDLQRYFPKNALGSRILLTSRNMDAIPHDSLKYVPSPLTNERCWELLQEKVFGDEFCPPELRAVGMRIAANCRGVPLAVLATAGILSSIAKEVRAWEGVRLDLDSYLLYGDINSVTTLSFRHLPDHLKPCLLYFGVFRENEPIKVRELLRFWIAEGFIGEKDNQKTAENVAEEYLMELINRELLMVDKRRTDGGVKTCVIHNIVRHSCLKICEGEKAGIHMRGAAVDPSLLEHICSLLGGRWTSPLCVHDTRSLRILRCGCIDSRYTGIETLVSLKYLVITKVPPSIGDFVNLEYLRVESQEHVYLSSAIMEMNKLRCIHVGSVAAYDEDCDTFQTNKLEYLSEIWIGEPRDEEMLRCSPHLRKLKLITSRRLDLSFLAQLESLSIRFHKSDMKRISFPSFIKKLTLCGDKESKFDCKIMSIIGRLENLEVLKLKRFFYTEDRWDVKEGGFMRLRFLKLDGISNLISLKVDVFPCLNLLILSNCYHLEVIPSGIAKAFGLKIIVKGRCQRSLLSSAKRYRNYQKDMGNASAKVTITDAYTD